MTRQRRRLITGAVLLPVLAYLGWVYYLRFAEPSVQNNTLVGLTEQQIRASYGDPNSDKPGYEPFALEMPPLLPRGSIRTLIFEPRGLRHPEGGTLWVWVVEQDGRWICFESCWFAADVVF